MIGTTLTKQKQIVIKKYQNRRLYNMATSSYITLDDLAKLIKQGAEITVIDAKTNVDLTRVTLTQIILEHEAEGYSMLPLEFLQQIIRLYDDGTSDMFRAYLLYMLDLYNKNQDTMQGFMKTLSGTTPLNGVWAESVEQMQQQSCEFFNGWWQVWGGEKNVKKQGKDGA